MSVLAIPPLLAAEQNTVHVSDAAQQDESHVYSIASGTLSDALLQFSEQSGGLQLVSPAELTEGKVTSGLSGRYSPREALSRILAGSGLGYRFYNATSFTLFKSDEQTNVLGAVRVDGVNSKVVGGVNGSTDVTATEGSGSYTSGALRIGSKTSQSLRETPQSVSVITQQQLQDQNISDFNGALRQATGVTVVQDTSLTQKFYSRGWEITTVQLDGGAPIKLPALTEFSRSSGVTPLLDLSMYDHVEVLRGADGLNGIGTSKPGGVVNLTRKRPLDHGQVSIETQAGSWDNYRTSLDVTGPLTDEGWLRGRAVATWQEKDFFYDTADDERKLLYGVLEADITPDTLLTLGGSYTRQRALPWSGGLPRYESGRDAHLPRSTSYALPWSRYRLDSQDLFAQLEHRFDDEWVFNAKVTRLQQRSASKSGERQGPVEEPGTTSFNQIVRSQDQSESTQWLGDASLSGGFQAFGLPQKVVLATSYSKSTSNIRNYDDYDFIDIENPYNPNDYPEPEDLNFNRSHDDLREWVSSVQLDLVPLPFLPSLHYITAARWTRYNVNSQGPATDDIDGSFSTVPITARESRFALPYHALRYDLTDRWSLYASYTELFEYQSYLTDVNFKQLDPMTGNNKEVGVKYANADGTLNASLSLYRAQRKDIATYDALNCPDGRGVFTCSTIDGFQEKSKGLDLEVSGQWLPGWETTLGYTYNKNKRTGGYTNSFAEQLPLNSYTPKHLFKLWNNVQLHGNPFLDRLQVGVGVNAQSKSYNSGFGCVARGEDGTCSDSAPYEFTQGFYATVSARLGYQINNNWNLALNVENLFDRTYYTTTSSSESGNWYGAPRNYMLSLRGNF
ncbi:TonB-dependent siderophore receptor [Pectobacterium araliae]|uniref:TonB-dependent siderophore receptor n=1 Tax=Pectobacterium araliae TaxID=3073862 RepID=A0AAN0K8H4_9GAMM|nr:TonB-dependent siderophore receptor [Pectobacterium sp. MAFF 302110]